LKIPNRLKEWIKVEYRESNLSRKRNLKGFYAVLLAVITSAMIVAPGCKKGKPAPQQTVPPPSAQKQQEQAPEAAQQTAVVSEAPQLQNVLFRYESIGLIDPFEPIIPKAGEGTGITSPLEQYSLDQLRLVAVIWGMPEPRAMIQDPQGRGFVVRKGTKMGKNQGVVIKILDGEITILEKYVDLLGKVKTNEVSMKLPKPEGGLR